MKKIAIIGFGFCGRIAFANLVKSYKSNYEVIVFDEVEKNFSGDVLHSAAFSEFSPHYILNVTAKKMTAIVEEEQHFCQFLQQNYPQVWQEVGELGFAPRQIYGYYLQKISDESFLSAKEKEMKVSLIKNKVVGVEQDKSKKFFLLTDSEGKTYKSDEIIIATSFKQTSLPFAVEGKNVVQYLWNQNYIDFHNNNFSNQKIALLGSGLTAVDVIVGLKKKGFNGKITVISRRGNFPKSHFCFLEELPNFISKEDSKNGLLFLCLKIRKFLRQNPKFDLRYVIHSIKPITVDLWYNFDERNKKLFLRLMPYWTIFRHRAPQSSIEIIDQMIAAGNLEIKNGGLISVEKESDKILLKTKKEVLEVDYLVNCLGFEFKAQKYPLLKQMLDSELLKNDLLMVQSNHDKIHLLGGLNVGKDFECTAVPDMLLGIIEVVKKCSSC
ncbi:MAG: hypothetical protein FJ368_03960 [Pelagibacterales bacterium]|nr:hypothetical protein [Pelagibacterales bacterium]